jgi:hypothetical protein
MLEALSAEDWGDALSRARAAAILNALHAQVGYPINYETILTFTDAWQLDKWNNAGCPLN